MTEALQTSAERYQRALAEQAAAERQAAKRQEQQAFLDRVAETRARIARGENVAANLKSPRELYNDIYSVSLAEQKAQAMQQRNDYRHASKDARNVPGWLINRLPPGDPLRKQAALMAVNPEDYE